MLVYLRGLARATLPAVLLAAVMGGNAVAQRAAAGLPAISISSQIGTDASPQEPDKDGSFLISVSTRNFRLDGSHIGVPPNLPGVGHYHVYADGIDPRFPFKYYVAAGATPAVVVTFVSLTRAGVTPGLHTLYVALAHNDHSLVEPLALATTVIDVKAPVPPIHLAIAGPVGTAANPMLPSDATAFTFNIALQNFTLDPAHIGARTNTPGSGHYHVYVDGIDPRHPFEHYVVAAATAAVRVPLRALERAGITGGTHTLLLALANNDHSLLEPLAMVTTIIQLGPALRVAELGPTQQAPIPIPSNGALTLHIGVMGFTLDAQYTGQRANVPGTGHYQVYVKGFDPARPALNEVAVGAAPVIEVPASTLARLGARAGVYPVYVVLANNDNTLVSPITVASGLVQIGA